MRSLRPMIAEERDFAELEHPLVLEFLRRKRLPMDDYYDVVIFGYLSAVQQYFRDPPPSVAFKAMAFRAMKDSILREGKYKTCAKRSGFTVALDDAASTLADPRQNTERQVEGKALLEQVASEVTPREAKIIGLLMDGFALREAARLLKMPMTAVISCMEEFCCRARAVIG